MHDDEIAVTASTVRALIAEQFPRWAQRPVTCLSTGGTEHTVWRLGEDMTVRLPRRLTDPAVATSRMETEAKALTYLADHCPVPGPRAVAIGRPGAGFPLPWAVQTYVPGTPATEADVAGSTGLARDLAELVLSLHAVPIGERVFDGSGRGGNLPDHDVWVQTCLERSEGLLDVPRLRRLWTELRDLPREEKDTMNHRDLIPGNILVADGRLSGILDGGGAGPADPALDLIVGWHLLDDGPRQVFRDTVGAGDLTWQRSRAWAFEQSIGLVRYYERTNPVLSRTGRRTLERLLASR